jgi:hypothetical protein
MRLAFWNPLAASCAVRWCAILIQFSSVHALGFAGTKQFAPKHFPESVSVFHETIAKFDVYHWPCSDSKFSNTSTGVSIALRHRQDHQQHHQFFSPPAEVQGRAGAVADHNWSIVTLHLCFYLPVSGTNVHCNTRRKVDFIKDQLTKRDFTVSRMHAELDQKERDLVIREFCSGSSRVLISTDLLACGIDVQQVSLVINFDLPQNTEIVFASHWAQ